MTEISLADWKAFLSRHPRAHLLQSTEWGELKSSFGWEAVRVTSGNTGAQILFRSLPLGFSFAYLPKGPVTNSAPGPGFWAAVDRACRLRRAVFLKVEPDGWEGEDRPSVFNGPPFMLSPHNIQPHSTLVIDLEGSEEDVFNRMKPKTRYNIRLAGRKEVVVHPSENIEDFFQLMTIT